MGSVTATGAIACQNEKLETASGLWYHPARSTSPETRQRPPLSHSAAKPLQSSPAKGLSGHLTVPGDKSISHRSLMLGAVAVGTTGITGLLEAEDVINTAKAMAALGAKVEHLGPGAWAVTGLGLGSFRQPAGDLDFGNSGTGARLAMGLLASAAISARFVGDASLSRRPMGRVTKPLEQMGARFEASEGGRLPLILHGARNPAPITYELPVASAQVKSAVLLAGLNTPGTTRVIEATPTRDHTERMLKAFGANIAVTHEASRSIIAVTGEQELKACDIAVPADPSSAAFPMVAALITEGSDITITNVMLNETRTGLITTLKEMGGNIEITNIRPAGGEQVGDLRVRASKLKAVTVPAARAASMIDEYPVLAVAAACAQGTTRMEGLEELRVKESDRLAAVEHGLQVNGVKTASGPDWLEVTGGPVAGGGFVPTHLDHRIAMSFLVLGLVAHKPVTVDDGNVIATSFPVFVSLMNGMGAAITPAGEIK